MIQEMFEADSYQSFIDYVARSLRSKTNYRLDVEISAGQTIATGEVTDCTRSYQFFVDNNIKAQYKVTGVRYDKDNERDLDRYESLEELLQKVGEKASPRELDTHMRGTGRFYIKKDITIPQSGENPLNNRFNTRRWLREFYQANGITSEENLAGKSYEELTEIANGVMDKYGILVEDIVPKKR
ncbi:hypothetical protein HYU21_04150 [Candidatus Woesearchaeota archaeon]|nr:hypothetical protein [Candidatus Woesearchaeota archaeon]